MCGTCTRVPYVVEAPDVEAYGDGIKISVGKGETNARVFSRHAATLLYYKLGLALEGEAGENVSTLADHG